MFGTKAEAISYLENEIRLQASEARRTRRPNPLSPFFEPPKEVRVYVIRKVRINQNGVPIVSDEQEFDMTEEEAASFGQITKQLADYFHMKDDLWWDWSTDPDFGKGNFFYPNHGANSDRAFAFGRWEPPL